MLLTRAPLNKSRITTQLVPCDLHVLNTPPAFVLSQNQTLRKNDLIRRSGITAGRISNRDCRPPRVSSLGRLHAPQMARSAQFNLFSLPNIARVDPSHRADCPRSVADSFSIPLLARPVLGHTVKDLPSRGLKSRSGGFTLNYLGKHLDRHPVSRPPSLVAAREAIPPRPHTSTHFD